MKTLSKYSIPILIVLVILFAALWLKGCGKKSETIEDYKWQNKYDSLQRIKQLLDSSLEDASKDAKLYQKHADSLQLIINNHEPETIVEYKDVYKRDSIINSLSVLQLQKQLADRFSKR